MPFKPGDPKPPGSGMIKGKKTRKTLKREAAHSEVVEEMRGLVSQLAGKSPDEIFGQMQFDPLIYSILMLERDIDHNLKVKLLDLLLKKRYPDLKALEISGSTTSEIKVTFGLPSADDNDKMIDATPSNRLTDGTQTSLQAVSDALWEDDEGEGAEVVQDRSKSLGDGDD